jgi:2,3-diaminopropionate biosynthesis protein SbnA
VTAEETAGVHVPPLSPVMRPPAAGRAVATQLIVSAGTSKATPMVTVRATVGGREVPIRLKMEAANRWGSIKDRTALALAASVGEQLIRPDAVLVESTSGNLGVALAAVAAKLDRLFVAVVDPNMSPALERRLSRAGAKLDVVTEPDEQGGYLSARLNRVTELLEQIPNAVWTDQYHNPANPLAHEQWTAPEILEQAPDADAMFVAVSTGGTLAGISRYMRRTAPRVRMIGVDVPGSRVFGEPTGTRLLTGIGASRRSTFLRPGDWDETSLTADATAIAMCHEVRRSTGLFLGGSSGAVVAACLAYLATHPEITAPVCVCPDGGESYTETLYDRGWLAGRGIDLNTEHLDISLRRDT